MIRKEIKDYLDEIERDIKPIDEYNIGRTIASVLEKQNTGVTDLEELAELIVFQFVPDYPDKNSGWGTYYGPTYILPNEQGQFVEFPSIQKVDQHIINYWIQRSNSPNPLLARQYADVALDLGGHISTKKFDYKLAKKVVESTIEICEQSLDDGLGCKIKLERALSLVKRLNDTKLLEKVIVAIIQTEKKFTKDDKPGLWGYAFEWLLLDDSGKISLSDDEKAELINTLESRLNRLMELLDPDPWHVENAVQPQNVSDLNMLMVQ